MRKLRFVFAVGLGLGISSVSRGVEMPAVYVNPYYSAATAANQTPAPRNLPAHPMTALGQAVRVEKLNEAYHATDEIRPRTRSTTTPASAPSSAAPPQLLAIDPNAKPLVGDTRAPTLMQTLRRDSQVATAAYTVVAPPAIHAAQPIAAYVPKSTVQVEVPGSANPLRRIEDSSTRAVTNPLRAE